jgi:sugar/nucleoside kinase (ribokinase family)
VSHRATGGPLEANRGGRFDYVTVGHVTIDVLADGTQRAGGSAFYSALQASRLGLRTLIVTRGVPAEIERMLEPYRGELSLQIEPAGQTTTLQTSGAGAARSQRMLTWAGPIADELSLETSILHLAPVARETPRRWLGSADFVGLTPQGLVREWSGPGGLVTLSPAAGGLLPERCDAIVMSVLEQASCAELISHPGAADAVVAITAGHRPTTVLVPRGESFETQAPATEESGEDLGAGDVFAAAFFIALSEGRAAQDAAAFAGAAAALRLGGPGTDGIAEREAIESRMGAPGRPA